MSTKTRTLAFVRTVNVRPTLVYRAFTNAMVLREWLSDGAQVSAREGGSLVLTWNSGDVVTGVFSQLKPDTIIAFSWQGHGDPNPTHVEIALKEQNNGTLVTLNHSGIGVGKAWDDLAAVLTREWQAALENLQSVLETGHDLRVMRRPMLGILPNGTLTAETATRLGIPVNAGLHLGSVVDGMGAQAAGLQADDVLVSLGGAPLSDFQSLTVAVAPHQAGDIVEVAFYRGSQQHTVSMKLSQRPIPEDPGTPESLAQQVREIHTALDAELEAVLAGVSEAEASQRPAPSEWSAKEVLAHLIFTERFQQFFAWGMVGGDDSIPWPDNNPAQIAGILAVYPTLSALVTEMKREEVATQAIAACLPESFVGHKASYQRLALNLLNLHPHNRAHFEQIKAAIAAAREPVSIPA